MGYIHKKYSNYRPHYSNRNIFRIINSIGNRKDREQDKQNTKDKTTRRIENILRIIVVVLQGILIWVTWQLVKSANKQADAAHIASVATEQSAKATEQSAAATQRSVTAIEKSVEISKQSADIQKKSMQIANRAYLSKYTVKPKKISDFTNIKIEVFIINTGQTPAYDVQSWSRFGIRKTCIDTLIRTSDRPIIATVVGKNETISIDRELSTNKIQIEKIKNRELFINFTGTIIYKDVFKQQHFFEYNFIYNISDEQYTHCPKHNDAN